MSQPRRRKSHIYEKWYGQSYTLKTLDEVKICAKCGRELPITSTAQSCSYCGGPLITKCVPKQAVKKHELPIPQEQKDPESLS